MSMASFVDSPHARGWQDALRHLMAADWRDLQPQTSYSAERFTLPVYQQVLAGKPRLAGARAVLEYFDVPGADRVAGRYAEAKQQRVLQLIEAGEFTAFPDALRFILAVKDAGIPVAAASSHRQAATGLRLHRRRHDLARSLRRGHI